MRDFAAIDFETANEQLVQRMLCSEANIDAQQLRTGQVPEAEWTGLWQAADKLAKAKIFIDDTPGLRIMEMRSKARRLQAQEGLDMIIVDYLQLMQGSNSRANQDNRQQENGEHVVFDHAPVLQNSHSRGNKENGQNGNEKSRRVLYLFQFHYAIV